MSNLDERVANARLKFRERWEQVCAKLAHLKRLDSLRVRYEARDHGYEFKPCLSLAEIAAIEDKLGAPLPPEVLFLYTTVGNGGPGPPHGLHAAQRLALWSIEEYRTEVQELEGILEPDDEGVEDEVKYVADKFVECGIDLSAVMLLCVLHREYEPYASCTDWLYVVCGGPKDGAVIARVKGDEHFVVKIGDSIADIMDKWLDREIELFHRAHKEVEATASLPEVWAKLSRLDLAALGQGWCYFYFGERGDVELRLPEFFRVIESLLGEELTQEGERLFDSEGRLRADHQARFQDARGRYLERARGATTSA